MHDARQKFAGTFQRGEAVKSSGNPLSLSLQPWEAADISRAGGWRCIQPADKKRMGA
jgi:hypothetical protein